MVESEEGIERGREREGGEEERESVLYLLNILTVVVVRSSIRHGRSVLKY